jgi:hypothetical protein
LSKNSGCRKTLDLFDADRARRLFAERLGFGLVYDSRYMTMYHSKPQTDPSTTRKA